MTDAVVVERLTKRFGETVAVREVSLAVRSGELFGFIGPDGAGKTTLFRVLATLLLPESGSARVLGHDVVKELWALRPRLGYMPGRFSLYPDLSVEENLRFFASVFGTSIEREYDQIEPIYVQLEAFKDRRAGALSGGMKQKLALCCALVHRPDILFLDEPTTGVDAVSRREFWELLARFKAGGLTIVVSTPYMDEATRCDRVALMQHGRLLAVDTPERITGSFDRALFAVRADQRYQALLAIREYPHTHTIYPFGEVLHYTDRRTDLSAEPITEQLTDFLASRGLAGVSAKAIPATIEDSFMAYLGGAEEAQPS
ncbi:MAG TPA: ABC transporter ATP-binding protein [Gemmatimonadales bacterium]|nr:ABC transporter ATP-binding protein [Gemmatimonadales bacterium]